MIHVSEVAEIPASADEVWTYIGDFNGLPRFVPAVTSSRLEGQGIGARRHIQVVGTEGETVEALEALDAAARRLSYSVQVSPLRMRDYYATIEVEDLAPDRCRLSWRCQFRSVDGDDGVETAAFIKASYAGAMSCLANAVIT